jgi:hypothetical protein
VYNNAEKDGPAVDNAAVQSNFTGMAALRQAVRRRALGSAVILSGEGDLAAAARFLAQAMECEGEGDVPCGVCNACRKVSENIHPDVVTVVDSEHKMISIDILRDVRSDAYILPNEGHRKVYIFPDCALLDPKGQNVLLKVVEEGPSHAVFLFCAENSALLLQTIRSRCTEWRLAEEAERDTAAAQELCRLLLKKDKLAVIAFFTSLETEKCKREDLLIMLDQSYAQLTRALLLAAGCAVTDPLSRDLAAALTKRQLNAAADLMKTYSQQLRFNLNVGHVTGALGAALAELL